MGGGVGGNLFAWKGGWHVDSCATTRSNKQTNPKLHLLRPMTSDEWHERVHGTGMWHAMHASLTRNIWHFIDQAMVLVGPIGNRTDS